MDPVSMLLFNALVRHQSINLPEIGSLSVQHTPARLQGRKLLTPPTNRVVFSPEAEQEAVSILTLIERSSGKDLERCNTIYQAWLESVRSEGQIRIPTVGMIAEGIFRPTEEINRIMNPFPTAAQKLKPKGRKNALAWVALSAVVVALALTAGYLLYSERSDAEGRSEELNQAKQTLQKTEVSTESLTQSAQGTQGTQGTQATPAPATTAVGTGANSTTATPSAVNTTSTHYYVIVGLYSTPENADRCIAQARTQNPTLNYGKLPQRTGRFLVYIADEPTSEQAEAIRQAHQSAFPESWILKKP